MSAYRRNGDRCQKWDTESGLWRDVPQDAPERFVRKKDEGMVVVNGCGDFSQNGPLILGLPKVREDS